MKKVIGLLLLMVITIPVFAQDYIIHMDQLKNVRDLIQFPELTYQEKLVIAEQAQLLLRDVYVNRYEKLDYYDKHPDPVPAIAKIVEDVDNLTTKEFELSLYGIFTSQRDLHLNYFFPEPYANYTSLIPFTLSRTAAKGNFFEVRVSDINKEVFTHLYPNIKIPEIGDEVIMVNGLPVIEAVEDQMTTAQGANVYGGFRRALDQLIYKSHRYDPVPEEDEITLIIKSHITGEEYSITIPWIGVWIEYLNPEEASVSSGFPGMLTIEGNLSSFEKKKIQHKKSINREFFIESNDPWQEDYNQFKEKFYGQNSKKANAYPSNASMEPTLNWGIIDNSHGTFGYLKIKSFMPDLGNAQTLNEIIRIIQEEFGDTDGLIIDVRDNGGGSMWYAEAIPQLFKTWGTDILTSRILNTDLNRYLMNSTAVGQAYGQDWINSINEAEGSGELYSDGNPYYEKSSINSVGQVYYKPVAVLNNAASYSATDMFSCVMKDNYIPVFGEEYKTGAGGANVLTQEFFVNFGGPPFVELPQNHGMRVAFGQVQRYGKNQGKIIEDYGCDSTMVVSPTLQDLLDGGVNQLNSITSYLAAQKAKFKTEVWANPVEPILYQEKDKLGFSVSATHTKYIKVSINGQFTEKIFINSGDVPATVDINLTGRGYVPGEILVVDLIGYANPGYRPWNMKKHINIIEDKIIIDEEGFTIDFSSASSVYPLAIVNNNTAPENGWNLNNGALTVGYNPNYANNVNTDALAFLDISGKPTGNFSFTYELDSEEEFDFLDVFVIIGGEKLYIFSESGTIPQTTFSVDYDLTPYAAALENVQLHFQFSSDMFVTATGAKIFSIDFK